MNVGRKEETAETCVTNRICNRFPLVFYVKIFGCIISLPRQLFKILNPDFFYCMNTVFYFLCNTIYLTDGLTPCDILFGHFFIQIFCVLL